MYQLLNSKGEKMKKTEIEKNIKKLIVTAKKEKVTLSELNRMLREEYVSFDDRKYNEKLKKFFISLREEGFLISKGKEEIFSAFLYVYYRYYSYDKSAIDYRRDVYKLLEWKVSRKRINSYETKLCRIIMEAFPTKNFYGKQKSEILHLMADSVSDAKI